MHIYLPDNNVNGLRHIYRYFEAVKFKTIINRTMVMLQSGRIIGLICLNSTFTNLLHARIHWAQ